MSYKEGTSNGMSSKETSNEIAIKVEHVGKTFEPQSSARTIKEGFVGLGRKLTGKKKLAHHKGEYTALKDISFEVKKGEFFGIVGRNGSGKSTLLKILAGVYTPTKGGVQVNGKLTPFIELGVGFNPELSGRDNVFLNGALLGFTRQQMEEMYDDIVDFAELHDFMDTKLKNYSSGMQVRLAFSVAIRAKSDILLIDEVLAVGDVNFQKKCFEYFKTLRLLGKTVVFVTHDMGAIKEYCDKAILIENSKIVKTKNVDDTLDKFLYIMDPSRGSGDKKATDLGAPFVNKPKIELTSASSEFVGNKIRIIANFKPLVNIKKETYAGISIKDNINSILFAHNTARLKVPIKIDIKKEAILWSFDNVLTSGDYFVNLSIVDSEGHAIERFEDCLKFSVIGKERSVTAINPNIELVKG